MSTEKKEKSFEEMLHRLEEIVRALDSAQTPLEESLSLFEEGAGLVRSCTEKLDHAQQKVTVLTQGPDGLEEKSFTEGA
jgi:exodeoxyribonuclease VII small subunit